MNIRHSAPRASLRDVERDRRPRSRARRNANRLPAILVPGCSCVACNEDVGAEAAHVEGEVVGGLETRVEFVEAALAADEDGHHVGETGRGVAA